MRAFAIALLAFAPVAGGCIHVHEYVEQRDRPLGEARVVEQRDHPAQVQLDADFADGVLALRAERVTPCQRRLQGQIERRERTWRRADAGSVLMMGLEGLGGVAALLGSAWVFAARDVEFQGGEAGRALNGIACLGLAGWLLGSLGYHIFYLSQTPTSTQVLDDSAWGPVQTCAREPLRRAAVSARVGTIVLQGTSDEQGQALLRAPAGVDLRSLLAGAGWTLRVQLESPRLEREVQVDQREVRPGASAAPSATDVPAPQVAAPASAPAGATPTAPGSADEPPIPEGPPAGAITLPPDATD